jgi:hypothetical protein
MMLFRSPRQAPLSAAQPDVTGAYGPPETGYSDENPIVGATQLYSDLSNGFGLRLQQTRADRRYRFADQADCSISGQMILGPLITSYTPTTVDSTNGISHFFEVGGSLYALDGRYALKFTGGNWNTVSKDFGSGKAALDVVVFQTNAAGGTNLAYVAMGDSNFIYKFDGTTWTQHASLYALSFAVVGRELYRGSGTNLGAKVNTNADPWTAANWSATNSFRIGDAASAITRMTTTASGVLLIFKTDGVYVLDEDGQDTQLYPDLKLAPSSTNGKYFFKFENWVHVTLTGRHFRIGPDLSLQPIGPERFADNDAPCKGYITGGVGTPYAAYAGLYNPDSGHSYLMKFGAFQLTDPRNPEPERIDAWHGSLSGVSYASAGTDTFSSRTIQAMYRTTTGAPASHELVWIGCSDGTIHSFILPCTPNPLGCSNYQYGASKSGRVFFPYWHGGFPTNEKVIRDVTAVGTGLATNSYADVLQVRTAGSSSAYTSYPSSGNLADSTPGERVQVEVTKTFADVALKLTNGSGAAATATPVVNVLKTEYKVNVPDNVVYEIPILCENGLMRRDGVAMKIGADQIRSIIKTALTTTAGVTIIFPDEQSLTCQLEGYSESMEFDEEKRQWRGVITVRAVESDTLAGAASVSLT